MFFVKDHLILLLRLDSLLLGEFLPLGERFGFRHALLAWKFRCERRESSKGAIFSIACDGEGEDLVDERLDAVTRARGENGGDEEERGFGLIDVRRPRSNW